ncbi:MAG: sialate O-acetylesterase, partial [Ignavibacteriaceae bacterium]
MLARLFKQIFLLFFFISINVFCQVKLPELISDGMVLQRNANVKIWGWASDGEKITIHFIDSTYNTIANKNGQWEIMLSKLKAGGPYVMKIDASNSITINDILVGDVWVCSGQSNMQLRLGWLGNIYQGE